MRLSSSARLVRVTVLCCILGPILAAACRPERKIDDEPLAAGGNSNEGGGTSEGGGSNDDDDPGMGGAESDTSMGGQIQDEDETLPPLPPEVPLPAEVVSSSPSSGSVGVATDTDLVVTFAEPMNVASVEAAFSLFVTSEAGETRVLDVEFDWNAERTVLTVRPLANFPRREVTSPTSAGWPVRYSIGVGATSAEGSPLSSKFEATFATLKRVTHRLNPTPSMSGQVTKNICSSGIGAAAVDYASTTSSVKTGERGTCTGSAGEFLGNSRGFVHYDLRAVPAEASLESASLGVTLGSPGKDGWETVVRATIDRVDYQRHVTTLASNVAGAAPLGNVWNSSSLATLTPTFTANGSRAFNVLTHVAEVLEPDDDVTWLQYRLRGDNTGPGVGDISMTSRVLTLVYTAP